MDFKKPRAYSRKECARIASIYASTDVTYTANEISITKGLRNERQVYRILNRAVVEGIADDDTVKMMKNKAAWNSRGKGGANAERRTIKHYDALIEKRNKYFIPKGEILKIARNYAQSDLNKEDFCKYEKIDVKTFDRSLKRAIVSVWISEYMVKKLKQKSLKRHNDDRTKAFWKELERLRSENKNLK